VLQAVRSEPGRTVGDYALILGLTQTALYRPVRELTDDRMIVKRARQLFPA
jgi:DNA-binding transcriptional ArsR family regulator